MQVYSTYVLQAILATLFVCIYGFQDLNATLTKRRKASVTEQNLAMPPAYQHSLDSSLKILWTSFIYFGSAVNVAALIYALIAKDGAGLTYTSFISCSAIGLCTQAILSVTMYRTQLSFSDLWYLGVCLLFAVITPPVFVERWYVSWFDSEQSCIYDRGLLFEAWMCQVVSCIWMMLWALARWRGWTKLNPMSKAHGFNLIRFSSLMFRTIHAALNLVTMWLFLYTFIATRRGVNELAGGSLSDNEWGFGQITAVLAWIPMLVEFARVWGLKGKRKRPFHLLLPCPSLPMLLSNH